MKFLPLFMTSVILCSCNILPSEFNTRSNEILLYSNSIFEVPSDCILPCVIGLEIGNEPDTDTISNLNRVEEFGGIKESGDEVVSYFLSIEPDGNFSTSLYLQGELIKSIELSLSYPESWLSPNNPFTFDNVLNQLDIPDEVYIMFSGPPAGYELLLIYEIERIAFQYRFIVEIPERFDGDPIPFCPLESPRTTLTRLSISVRNSDYENWLLDIVPDLFDEIETRPWRQLNDLTEFAQHSLFDSLDTCIDLTTFEALRNMGYQY